MVVYRAVDELSDAEVDGLFHALADATRRDIVARSLQGEHSVTDLARQYAMSFAAVQKHVAVLERAGLVAKQARGRERVVHGNVDAIRRAARLLDSYQDLWRHRALAIENLLGEETTEEDRTAR